MPIIEYLDETRVVGFKKLLPRDAISKAKSRAIAEVINSGMQPYQNANVLKRITREMGREKKEEWLKFYMISGLKSLEMILRETSGKYCVGDEVSLYLTTYIWTDIFLERNLKFQNHSKNRDITYV